jgi:hypothetical protein
MKKIFLFGLAISMATLGLISCNDDHDQLTDSRVTYFANLELLGDEVVEINVGETFTDPGYIATEGEEDITSKVKVTGSVDTSKGGFYTLTYSVSNKDNFSVEASRLVMVKNPNSLASAYYGESQYGSRHYYDAPITITDRGNGTYLIDDLAGGFYCYGRYPGYEPTYDFHCEAVIKLNADNTIELVQVGDWYWAPTFPTITSGSYDPETGTVTLIEDFSGSPLKVVLTK